jgi:hypothetical protein
MEVHVAIDPRRLLRVCAAVCVVGALGAGSFAQEQAGAVRGAGTRVATPAARGVGPDRMA